MAASSKVFYQYETSPRKLEPDYKPSKKNNKSSNKKNNKAKLKKTNLQIKKEKEILQKKLKFKVIIYVLVLFAAFFVITYRNSQIDESFMKVKSMQSDLALLQKENEQLKVNIENSFNLSTIEQQAKELLGMQKLDNSQKEYISLPKKDFVEPVSEKIIFQDGSDTWYEKLLRVITNLW